MRRHPRPDRVVLVPAELVDYRVWCANRGLTPFGVYGTPEGDVAVDQHRQYLAARCAWADAHGVDEQDMDFKGHSPFYPI